MQCLCVGHMILYSIRYCCLHSGVGFEMISIGHFKLAVVRASSYFQLAMQHSVCLSPPPRDMHWILKDPTQVDAHGRHT